MITLHPSSTLGLLASLALLAGCGKGESAKQPDPLQREGVATATETAERFFTAVRTNDRVWIEHLLTQKARKGYADSGVAILGDDLESIEIGEATIDGQIGKVPVTLLVGGMQHDLTTTLAIESGAWRVCALSLWAGDELRTIDFEERIEPLPALADEIPNGVTGTELILAAAAPGRARVLAEVARDRESYAALRSVSSAEHDDSWQFNVYAAGRAARDVLVEVLGGTGSAFDMGELAPLFDKPLFFDLRAVSRLYALEKICSALEVVPVFPAASWRSGSEDPRITFRAGERQSPVTFAGPFLIEATKVEEHVPDATGALTLRVWSLGLAPSVLAANDTSRGVVGIEALTDALGTSLLARTDIPFAGEATVERGLFSHEVHVELSGLLRGVESIDRVAGTLELLLPAELQEVRYYFPAVGSKRFGDWLIECTSLGKNTSFEFELDGRELDPAAVRFAPDQANGSPLEIRARFGAAHGGKLMAEFSTLDTPAALGVKVYRTESVHVPFEIEDIRLARSSQQPVSLEPFEFAGGDPLVVTFLPFPGGSDPGDGTVRLSTKNNVDKDVVEARVTFQYFDGTGEFLRNVPHRLSGTFHFDGTEPLVTGKAVTEHDTRAFSMPEETRSVNVRIESVLFADGTTWTRL